MSTTITWTCPNCDRETAVTVWPFVPAKLSGHSDTWRPAEGGEIEPDVCVCGAEIDVDHAHEMAGQGDEL